MRGLPQLNGPGPDHANLDPWQSNPLVRAVYRSQAVIEFDVDGTIRSANDNFLNTVGYTNDEIRGKHHRMFVDPQYAASEEYRDFWNRLRNGEYFSQRVRRFAKDGSTVWLQATYNPVFGPDGTPERVIKFATDVTAEVEAEERRKRGIEAMFDLISKSASTAADISSATEELAATTDTQSEYTQKVSTAGRSMAEAARANADEGSSVASLASGAGERAREGLAAVQTTIERSRELSDAIGAATRSVEQLGESGREIQAIIGVIDDIADRTNMLALNAAIEAARAGQYGKGFAVVANEVRDLARRTQQATAEITEKVRAIQSETERVGSTMHDSEAKMNETRRQADNAGSSLSAIVEAIADTVQRIQGMSEALTGQTAISKEMASSVESISNAAIESATAVRRIADSASGLSDLTENLREEVARLQAD